MKAIRFGVILPKNSSWKRIYLKFSDVFRFKVCDVIPIMIYDSIFHIKKYI